jgi:hypothetical protein
MENKDDDDDDDLFHISWPIVVPPVDYMNMNKDEDTGLFQLPYPYQLLFQVSILLEPLGDGVVKFVTVVNCYIY